MSIWVIGTGDGQAGTPVTASSPEDAASQAKELIRRGATAIAIKDETRPEISLKTLERQLHEIAKGPG